MNLGTISQALWAGNLHGNRGCVLMNCVLGDWLTGPPPTPLYGLLLSLLLGRDSRGPGLGRGDGNSLCSSHPGPCGVVHYSCQCCGDKRYSEMIPQPHCWSGGFLPPQRKNTHTPSSKIHTQTHTHNSSGLSAVCFPNLSKMWKLQSPPGGLPGMFASLPALFCLSAWFVHPGCFSSQSAQKWT